MPLARFGRGEVEAGSGASYTLSSPTGGIKKLKPLVFVYVCNGISGILLVSLKPLIAFTLKGSLLKLKAYIPPIPSKAQAKRIFWDFKIILCDTP